jgi:septum formation protein
VADAADHRGALVERGRGPALVLASGSPRRRALLGRLGIAFTITIPDIDESPVAGEAPTAYVERLARAKAVAAAARSLGHDRDEVVVAADTTVDVDGDIVGKPADDDEAAATLARLSGREHLVHTGVAVHRGERLISSVTTSTVRFHPLAPDVIAAYVATGEPLDKAGGYGLQGEGRLLVAAIEGSASNVIGLPMAQTGALLTAVGFEPVQWGPPRSP